MQPIQTEASASRDGDRALMTKRRHVMKPLLGSTRYPVMNTLRPERARPDQRPLHGERTQGCLGLKGKGPRKGEQIIFRRAAASSDS